MASVHGSPTEALADKVRTRDPIEMVAEDFELPLDDVIAALSYGKVATARGTTSEAACLVPGASKPSATTSTLTSLASASSSSRSAQTSPYASDAEVSARSSTSSLPKDPDRKSASVIYLTPLAAALLRKRSVRYLDVKVSLAASRYRRVPVSRHRVGGQSFRLE